MFQFHHFRLLHGYLYLSGSHWRGLGKFVNDRRQFVDYSRCRR